MSEHDLSVVSIDDDPADSDLLARTLRRIDGWCVAFRSFDDATQGLIDILIDPPDVVFVDLLMAPRTGLEILQCAVEDGYAGPMLMLTGNERADLAVECLRAGAADFVSKDGLVPERLRRAISNALERFGPLPVVEQPLGDVAENGELRHPNVFPMSEALANELKTPLLALIEFTEPLLRRPGHVTPLQDDFDYMAAASRALLDGSFNDLLDLADLEAGTLRLDVATFSSGALLRRAVRLAMPLARRRGVKLQLLHDAPLPEVQVDPRRMLQVLVTLLRNSLVFTSSGGSVTVHAGPSANRRELQIVLRDTGAGPASEEVEAAVHSSGDHTRAGMNVSLYVCCELIRLQGGSIRTHEGTSIGSQVIVTVPLPHHRAAQARKAAVRWSPVPAESRPNHAGIGGER